MYGCHESRGATLPKLIDGAIRDRIYGVILCIVSSVAFALYHLQNLFNSPWLTWI